MKKKGQESILYSVYAAKRANLLAFDLTKQKKVW
jgi:hypothetical protein